MLSELSLIRAKFTNLSLILNHHGDNAVFSSGAVVEDELALLINAISEDYTQSSGHLL